MKIRNVFLSIAIITFSLKGYTQDNVNASKTPFLKNQVGIQLNPGMNDNRIVSDFIFALRYGYNISKPVVLGAELSETIPAFGKITGAFTQYNDFKIGLFARYVFFPEKRVQGFIEVSPFYSHRYFHGFENLLGGIPKNIPGIYLAPGLSAYTKNRRFSLDLYYKIYVHPTSFYYYRKNVLAYKLTFHF